ncbi:MAG: hypothetical protein VZR00_10310 [Lachnospiraceae bacterium]|nr:hypothetical protein [Lachnospiraceae bacterium]MEE3462255.1 hypothetical protein [Lachnospiraceae bacterium]
MKDFMNDLRERGRQFMEGRYGADHVSNFIIVAAFIFIIISMFVKNDYVKLIFSALAVGMLIFSFIRMFSKNQYKRYEENEKYLKLHNAVKDLFHLKAREAKQKKQENDSGYKLFKCPGCSVKIRVPKGKGRVEIVCPKCHAKFIRKT